MMNAVSDWSVRALLAGAVLVGLAGMAGCGGGGDQQDRCAETTCQLGVCAPETGECVNRSSCRTDTDCLIGYECGEGNQCRPQAACESDADCETGTCDGEACVNPESCESDDECVDRSYCGEDGTCQLDPCTRTDCRRGVCETGTGECVSADSCTRSDQLYQCVSGEKCLDGSCKTEEEFCEALTCDRGVCSFEAQGCVDADDCGGDDANCTEGHVCNGMDNCQRDLCVRDDVTCHAGGGCDPATGLCENAEPCEETADCLTDPEHVCVEGSCRLVESACGDAAGDGGCPGHKTCEIDREAMTATCQEPDRCETSIDCNGDRQCGGRSCIDPVSCVADVYEPNDALDAPTDLDDLSTDGRLEASLCSGDRDVYAFESSERDSGLMQGTIEVAITIPDRDIGLGDLEVALYGPDGSELGSETLPSNATGNRVTVTAGLQTGGEGQYKVEVTPGDTFSQSGLTYQLAVNILTDNVRQACRQAETIDVNQRISETTDGAASSQVRSSCRSGGSETPEKLYRLDLETSRRLTITAMPRRDGADLSVSVRGQCTESETEIACAQRGGAGEDESITHNFAPGTHYIAVEAGDSEGGEPFDITVDPDVDTRCTDAGNYCSDGSTAHLCDLDGGGFQKVACDEGCNPSTGRCFPPAGDVCQDAPSVSSSDSTKTHTVDLLQYRDNYELGSESCLETDDPRTDGPDRAFTVDLEPRESVTVTATFENEVEGAMYLAETCTDADSSCLVGAQGSTDTSTREVFRYSNLDEQPRSRTLVVDTAAGQHLGDVEVAFEFTKVICDPASKICTQNGEVDTCKEYGTEYETTDTCGLTCSSGVCDGETCGQTYDLTQEARNGGVTKSLSWSDFRDDYQSSCGDLDGGATGGGDAVFEIDLRPGDTLEATLGGGDTDVGMYLTSDCQSTDSCLAEVETSGGRDGTLSYTGSDSGETVYLHADASGNSTGQFTLEVEATQKVCTPDTVLGCAGGDVEYCSSSGLNKKTYNCTASGGTSGCSNGECNNKVSEHCFDADDITSEAKGPGGATRSPNWSNKNNDLEFDACGVSASDSAGPDAVYRIDLQGDETLKASLEGQLNGPDASVRVIGDCLTAGSTCKEGDTDNEHASVRYDAASPQTVYVVADWNSDPGSGYEFKAEVRTRCSTSGTTSCSGTDTLEQCSSERLEEPFGCSSCCSASGGDYDDATAVNIPNNNGLTRTINVSGCSGTASKVVVSAELDLAWRGDLDMHLTSPQGTEVTLETTSDGFDTDAFGGLKYYPLDYQPVGSLSDFNGESANGDWDLYVEDETDTQYRGGTFHSWSLAVACN